MIELKYDWYKQEDIPDWCYRQMFGIKQICVEMKSDRVLYTDCCKWLIVTNGKKVVGFSGIDYSSRGMHLRRAFVYPEYRNLGVYKKMLKIRLEEPHKVAFCEALNASAHQLANEGFCVVERKKNGFVMERENV